MSAAKYVPGMKPGATVRNAFVGLGYLVTLPIWLAFLWLTLPVMVWGNSDDVAEPLSVLPGISERGGGFAAGMTFLYVAGVYALLFPLVPGRGGVSVGSGLAAATVVALVVLAVVVRDRWRARTRRSESNPFDDRVDPDEDGFRGTQHQRVGTTAEERDGNEGR